MQPQKELITETALLEMANKIIKEHEDFIHGMRADSVEQKGDILVFKGGVLPRRRWHPDRQDHGGIQHVQAAGPATLRQVPAGLSTPNPAQARCRPQAASVCMAAGCAGLPPSSPTTQLRPAILAM